MKRWFSIVKTEDSSIHCGYFKTQYAAAEARNDTRNSLGLPAIVFDDLSESEEEEEMKESSNILRVKEEEEMVKKFVQ